MGGGWWERHVVPRVVDRALRGPETEALRIATTAGLFGRVLEPGFGSGLNARYYPEAVTRVDAMDPSDTAWRLSEPRRTRSRVPVGRVGLDGQRLETADATYDTALITWSLCTIADPAAVLDQVVRVLRPGGTLHLVEHGLAPDEPVRRWQRRLDPFQQRLLGGCHLTRDTLALLSASALEVTEVEAAYLEGIPRAQGWMVRAVARATPSG